MNKKAMFFTILAVALLSLFLISFTLYFVLESRESVGKRVKTLNNFVSSVEEDIPRQLYVSGYRIIFLLEKHIADTGSYINDLNNTVNELFYNGSISGVSQSLMKGANFSDIAGSFNRKASKINAKIYFINSSLTISQDDPWNVRFDLTVNFVIEDLGGLALWNKTSAVSTEVHIGNFDDPVYVKNGVVNKINETPYNIPIGSDLNNHVRNSYYINTTISPDFLNRMAGTLAAQSPYGIESLVDKTDPNIPVSDKSIIDHDYFSGEDPATITILGYDITTTHRDFYEP
jgi:hypothetical protein